MKTDSSLAAWCCTLLLVLSAWAVLPAQAQDHSVDLEAVVAAYMDLAAALADDNVEAARTAAGQMVLALRAVDSSADDWIDLRERMSAPLGNMSREDADIEAVRRELQPLSSALEQAAVAHDYPGPLKRAFCPMAFDFTGATWLQRDNTIANPYFGASMLRCGEIQHDYSEPDHEAGQHDAGHGQHEHGHGQMHPVQAQELVDQVLGQQATAQYVCPMHPQIVRDAPADCPICGMDLVLRRTNDGAAATVSIHPAVQQAMNLRTAAVQRGRLEQPISALGRIELDQSSITRLTPRTEGWIGELDLNSVGESVRPGQRLFTLYSRELVNLQDEFLQALRGGSQSQITATRQRLEVLGVQSAVIERIREGGRALTWVPWYAERAGYVVELNARPGSYVMPGLDLIELANLSSVWLIAEVAGTQIQALEAGQHAQIQIANRPGDDQHGRVELVYPELDPTTRTARARIRLDNTGAALSVGDWASVQIDGPARENALYIPSEALIRTGTEERVVIRDDEKRFSVRQVHAGIESGEFTEILHGLEAGETVVVSGQFLIDSEASIRAGHRRLTAHDHH